MSSPTIQPCAVTTARPSLRLRGLSLSLWASLSSSPCIASSLATPPNHETAALPTVVVTAAFQDSPLSVVLNPQAPVQPIPASDGADLLKTVPGFAVMRKGGSNGDPVLRGMTGSRLAIVMDGSLIAGGCPSRMDPPTAYISPALFDKVTIIKGPETVLYGPVGSAGTVLFERTPPDYRTPAASLHASTTAGSWGRNDQTISFKAGTPQFYLSLNGNRTQAGDYHDGRNQRVHSNDRRWDSNLALGWTPDRQTLLELSAGTGNGQAAYAFSGMDGVQFLRQSLAIRFEKRGLSEHWSKLEAKLYHNHVDHVMDNYSLRHPDPDSMMPMAMASELSRDTDGGRLAASFDWDERLNLTSGIDASRSRHTARSGGPADRPDGGYRAQARLRDAQLANIGVFIESNWQMSERDRLLSGLRLDRQFARAYPSPSTSMSMSMPKAASNMAAPSAISQSRSASRHADLVSGFIRYEHQLATQQTIYLGLGHAERFPDYWELFGRHVTHNAGQLSTLRPERTSQLDIGWQLRQGPWHAWVSAYAGQIADYILIHYGRMQGYADNVNARIAGTEAGAEYTINPAWKASLTLADAWGQNVSEDRPLAQMTPLEARLGLEWQQQAWSAGVLLRLVDHQHRVAIGEGSIVGQDLGRTGGFTVFSLHAGWRINRHWQVNAGIDNLFNKTYVESISPSVVEAQGFSLSTRVNEPGRIEWLKLSMDL